jgi:hypothetical protein
VEGEEGEADAAVEGDEEGGTTVSAAGGPQPPPPPGPAQAWPMAFGWLSVAGRSREMEDAVSLRPGFCTWVDGSPMHFFGVFDGHGGSHVSMYVRLAGGGICIVSSLSCPVSRLIKLISLEPPNRFGLVWLIIPR